MTRQKIFSIRFHEAYSFRNLLNILKTEINKTANLHLRPKEIFISEINSDIKNTLFHFSIRVVEIEYNFNVRDSDGNLVEEVLVGFKTNEMLKAVKSVKKKEGLVIYMYEGDTRIHLQLVNRGENSSKHEGVRYVDSEDVPVTDIDIPIFERGMDNPNVRVPANYFSPVFTHANTNKCSHVEAVCYPKIVHIFHYTTQKVHAAWDKFCEESEGEEKNPEDKAIHELLEDIEKENETNTNFKIKMNIPKNIFRIPPSTIKTLSKISNVSQPGSVIKIYYEENKPLFISTNVGVYGTLNLYIRNVNSQEK